MRAIHEKEQFEVKLVRYDDGVLEVDELDRSLSCQAGAFLTCCVEDTFCECPEQPGYYMASGLYEYYSHPGDFSNPPEEGETAIVERFWEVAR